MLSQVIKLSNHLHWAKLLNFLIGYLPFYQIQQVVMTGQISTLALSDTHVQPSGAIEYPSGCCMAVVAPSWTKYLLLFHKLKLY